MVAVYTLACVVIKCTDHRPMFFDKDLKRILDYGLKRIFKKRKLYVFRLICLFNNDLCW